MIVQNTISKLNLFQIESFDSWVCYFEEPQKKICWMSQQGIEKSIFRVSFGIDFDIMTTMILQNTILRFKIFQIESVNSWVYYFGDTRKTIMLNVTARNRVIFWIEFEIMTAMILQNTISTFQLFYFKSFDSWARCFGKQEKKICWMSQQGTEKRFFRVIFWIGFGIMTAMILQNTNSRFTLFFRECYFGKPRKKKSVEYCSKKWRRAFSELSFELAVSLWLHWFWKKQFPDLIYLKLNILIAKWVIWRATKKKTF